MLTVVLPVKNEESNLRRSLPLLKGHFNQVVVADSGSTDLTESYCREVGVVYLNFAWDGKFPKKRNWVLRHYKFTTDWVLFLDADEFVSEAFVDEVKSALANTRRVGFWLNYENYFMGKRLNYGDPMRKLALFRVGAGEYERIEEDHWSHLDMEIHEHPVLKGEVGEIRSPIEHNDFRGLNHYIAKHNEYSSWEAHRYLRLKKNGFSGEEWNGLTNRQKKKYRNIHQWWFAPAYFMASYIFKKGFLDGAVGFHFALMKAIYFYQIRLKIKETQK